MSASLITCLVALLCVGCNNNIDTTFPKITHLAFQTEENGNWGMINVDGKVLFENKINYRLDLHPSYAVNGVYRTWEFDQIQRFVRLKYYTATGEPKQIGLTEGYKEGGVYSEGIIPVVVREGRIHYINISGDTVFCLNPYKGKEIVAVSSFFTDQRAWFMLEDYKFGYIDPKGNVVIEPIYDNAFPFYNGKALVYNKEQDKYITIEVNGRKLFEVSANGHHQNLYHSLLVNDYCVIGNFLCNERGEREQRFPPANNFSPFNKGTALFQDAETDLWQLINVSSI